LDSNSGSLASLQKFDLFYKFVNEAMKDGLLPQMTWLQNIETPANDNEYALKLIFVVICSKRAKLIAACVGGNSE